MVQLVECLPCMHRAVSLLRMHTCNPNILQKDQEFKVSVRDVVSLRSAWAA